MIKIKAAAITFKKKYTYTGRNHSDCMEKMFNKTGEIVNEGMKDYHFGFVDNQGNFYSRFTAANVARKSGQILDRYKDTIDLYSYMIKF